MLRNWYRSLRGRRGVAVDTLVSLAIGVLLLGILLPIGLSHWENYTPTDSTLLAIWPIGAVLCVLGAVLNFFRGTQGKG